jgi:uncharacterized protein YbjT (DUF2867 family)
MILVLGATGQLGTAVTRVLLEEGRPVRAMVRPSSEYRHLEAAGARLVYGDLRDGASLAAACRGVEVVIATATGIAPGRGGGDVKAVDDEGYARLIAACVRAGVRQFVFASTPPGPLDDRVLLTRAKRRNEERLKASGLGYTIFQLGMFADVWPALLGSRIPERGSDVRTLDRPFWFTRAFRRMTGDLIEGKGRASVPGRPDTGVSFIAIDDVARLLAAAAGHPDALNQTFQVGGPETLTWAQTVETFARVLSRPVRPSYAPAAPFRVLQLALSPFSPSAASLMGLNWITARGALPAPDPEASVAIAARFGVTLQGFEEFLVERVRGAKSGTPSSRAERGATSEPDPVRVKAEG